MNRTDGLLRSSAGGGVRPDAPSWSGLHHMSALLPLRGKVFAGPRRRISIDRRRRRGG
ncbi:hypothetical protein GS506_03930 [Rhodococcus hoagii]|nr:hypothetical protein [Prescottella equi]